MKRAPDTTLVKGHQKRFCQTCRTTRAHFDGLCYVCASKAGAADPGWVKPIKKGSQPCSNTSSTSPSCP